MIDHEPKRMRSEFVYMISASFVAIVALVVSIWQGYETRKHNRLSVKPYLTFSKNFGTHQYNDSTVSAYQLVLKNSGTGPAIIRSYDLFYDGLQINEDNDFSLWQNAVNKAEKLDMAIFQSSSFDPGDVIESGFNKSILKMTYTKDFLEKVKLRIVFESIYEEEFKVEALLLD